MKKRKLMNQPIKIAANSLFGDRQTASCGCRADRRNKKSSILLSSVAAGAMEVDTVASRFYSVIMIVQNDARVQSPNPSDCSVSEAYPTTTTEHSTTATFTTDGKLDDSYTET